MLPSLLSYMPGACSDSLIHLTLLKRFRCSELGGRRSLKFAPLRWVFVSLQKLENGLLGVWATLRCTSWIRAGRELSGQKSCWTSLNASLAFPSITQQILILWRPKSTRMSSDICTDLASFSAHLSRISLHLDLERFTINIQAYS